MSSELPPHPNLEHLKKQARERLRELQMRVPGAQLADVQHALAREYGFASWPKLKAHVDALASSAASPPTSRPPQPPAGHDGESSPRDYGFNQYSERAKKATFFSRWEASQLGSPTIECEHLLLGVVHARQDIAPVSASGFAPPIAEIRATVGAISAPLPALPTSVIIPFSEAVKVSLARAAEAALNLRHDRICTRHLLVGLMQSGPSVAATILGQHGVSPQSLLDDADTILGEG
jgi:hypothetical protein